MLYGKQRPALNKIIPKDLECGHPDHMDMFSAFHGCEHEAHQAGLLPLVHP